jgi:hypothetical protein
MTGFKSKKAMALDKLDSMEREALKLALDALEQTLKTLDDENAQPGGAIADTIWYSEHITLFDYLASEITAIKEVLAQPAQERNFCPRCGKRTRDLTTIHTCTPPQEKNA